MDICSMNAAESDRDAAHLERKREKAFHTDQFALSVH
jgi:hypothetical protein